MAVAHNFWNILITSVVGKTGVTQAVQDILVYEIMLQLRKNIHRETVILSNWSVSYSGASIVGKIACGYYSLKMIP